VRPVIAVDAPGLDQLQIGLMGESAGLNALRLESAQVIAGDEAEIAVDQRHYVR